MQAQEIYELAKSLGFKVNHFLRLRDLKSGVVIAGQFTAYKQHQTNGLRLKGDTFEVEVITDGKANFEVLQSVNLDKPKLNVAAMDANTEAENRSIMKYPQPIEIDIEDDKLPEKIMSWISVKDRLPLEDENDDTCIILVKGSIAGEDQLLPIIHIAEYDVIDQRWVCVKNVFDWGAYNCYFPEDFEYEGRKWVVTHWMFVNIE